MVINICAYCKKEYKTFPCRIKAKRIFCKKECYLLSFRIKNKEDYKITLPDGSSALKIPLTKGKFTLIDEEDFELTNSRKWRYDRYASAQTHNKPIYLHALIMKTPKGMDTDHINGNKLDNRKINLRICSRSQNLHNVGLNKRNKSGYHGVRDTKRSLRKRFTAIIIYERKVIRLGYFLTAEEAARTYDAKARELFGEFASLNFPQSSPK